MNHSPNLLIIMLACLLLLGACNQPDDHSDDPAANDSVAGEHDHASDHDDPGQDHGNQQDHDHHDHADHDHSAAPADDPIARLTGDDDPIWTCPMHPQIVRDEPGNCPICGMRLVEREDGRSGEAAVEIPAGIQQTMNIRTATVERSRLFRRIDTLGRVQVDESALHHLHPRVEGWIGELDIDATGEGVEAGQRLFTLYSPELVNIQEEFLQALRSGRAEMARASRDRLAVLGVQPRVIERIERDREVLSYLPWYAESDGYVMELDIRPGMYVAPGSEMAVIADPARVWLMAEVLGGQIDWLAEGQRVEVERPAHPEATLEGRIDFVYPERTPVTRAAQSRIVLDNPDGSLRPGEWTRLAIYAGPREDLLIVPTEALIRTGTETRVIVRDDEQRFSARVVHAGMSSGRYTAIRDGLGAGEEVVTSGQFLIDSEASIRAGHDRLGGQHDH